jgi:hypothetical protein
MSVGCQNFFANAMLSSSEQGQILFIHSFSAILTSSSPITGIKRLDRGIITFFQIYLLYLLSFGCTSNATSQQHASISHWMGTYIASHFASIKYLSVYSGIFSLFRKIS